MFQTSWDKYVAPELTRIASDIEGSAAGLHVLAARQFRYPVFQSMLEIFVTEPRRFNVLEEFMLRAALELEPPPSLTDLAQALGLDYVFLDKTFRDLEGLGAVTIDPDLRVSITEAGKKYHDEGQIPKPPRSEKVLAIFDPLSGIIAIQKERAAAVSPELPDLATVIDIPPFDGVLDHIPLSDLQEVLLKSSLQLHNPKEGKVVTGYNACSQAALVHEPVSLFVLYDEVEESWAIQLRKGRHVVPNSDKWLVPLVDDGSARIKEIFSISDLDFSPDESEIENEISPEDDLRNEIQQLRLEAIKRNRAGNSTEETTTNEPADIGVDLFCKHEIRPEFLKILRAAQREVVIFSPHITEQAVDDELFGIFKELANRNVWILIAHGIASTMERESRPFPVSLVNRLIALRSPQGAPVCCVVFFGRSHDKDVLVDRSVYLNGSYNFLSYHGKWNVRGETINKFTIPRIVGKKHEKYVELYLDCAEKSWAKAVKEGDKSEEMSALTIWGALGRELEALNSIKEAARYELLPVWSCIAANNVKNGDVLYYATCLEAAAGLFPDIQTETAIEGLADAWKTALCEIKKRDEGLALTILEHPSWSEYERLGISSPQSTREAYFNSLVEKKVVDVSKNKKKKKHR